MKLKTLILTSIVFNSVILNAFATPINLTTQKDSKQNHSKKNQPRPKKNHNSIRATASVRLIKEISTKIISTNSFNNNNIITGTIKGIAGDSVNCTAITTTNSNIKLIANSICDGSHQIINQDGNLAFKLDSEITNPNNNKNNNITIITTYL